ncbi:MAG: NUDIX domain-containing protein [Pseudolabrys sp.]|nr:NUDIX domain-containing protein [Pseudolabrys sp.]
MASRQQKPLHNAILAAGGIVIAPGRSPLVAIVQRRKDNAWVLPKGKLKPKESVVAAARREVTEETGHRVAVHEFLGAVSYESGSKPKIVQFWRMVRTGSTRQKPTSDIRAVEWLPLQAAIARLNQPLERAFLMHVGQQALGATRIESRSLKARQAAKATKLRLKTRAAKPVRHDAIAVGPASEAGSPNLISRIIRRLQKGTPVSSNLNPSG